MKRRTLLKKCKEISYSDENHNWVFDDLVRDYLTKREGTCVDSIFTGGGIYNNNERIIVIDDKGQQIFTAFNTSYGVGGIKARNNWGKELEILNIKNLIQFVEGEVR